MKKHINWLNSYWHQIERNIGLISKEEQEKLRKSKIAVLGLGGLGGSVAEQLIRSGCEKLVICDNDTFENSNLNRQLCSLNDLGKYKIDVIEKMLKGINPNIILQTFYEIDEFNISKIIQETKVVALTLDDPLISVLIARECQKQEVPMVESWGIPYIFAWWFTSNSIDYETCYNLNSHKLSISDLKNSKLNEFNQTFKRETLSKLLEFPNIKETYNREPGILEALLEQNHPFISLSPIIRLNASYLTFEIIYSGILEIKEKILAPKILGYDYLRMKSIEFNI
ncbi:MAG: ThiF family adenylyltransferase [Candidatus Hodarchaeota archaeon]